MKREPHWVKLFLRELERTGNVRLAAEGAGVDYTSAYQRRKRHAEFAEAWALRLAAFRDGSGQALRLAAFRDGSGQDEDEREGEEAPPPSVGRSPSPGNPGADEVFRPDGKVIKGSEARWGKRAEERFFTELTVSANVRLAAAAAGFSTTAVYKRRLKDRRFRAAWDAAVETGKARVQAYLVEAATRTFDPDELPIGDEREIPRVSISEAINNAKLKAAEPSTTGAGRAGRGWDFGEDEEPGEDDINEAHARIRSRLDNLRARNEREMTEAGWTEHGIPAPPYYGGEDQTSVWLPPGYRLVRDEGS